MGRLITGQINDFSLGSATDPREPDTRYAQLIKNFDAHTFKKKLVPLRSSESGATNGDTDRIRNFAIARQTGTTYSLYGLGRISATDSGAEIFRKDLTIGAANDLDDADWALPTANLGTTGATINYNLFVFYRQTGLIYGGRDGTNLWAFSPTGTAFDNDIITTNGGTPFSYTFIGQGVIHSKDDNLYIPYYNNNGAIGAKSRIAKNDSGTWTIPALTLPDHLIPISISEYGNDLAIACQPASGIGESIVYLWNRDETTTILAKSIPWGEGNLTILEELEGYLVGVSYTGAFNATANTNFKQKAVFKYYAGSKPITFLELVNETTFDNDPNDIPIAKQKVNNYLYFVMKITLNGVIHHGVWKVGRTKSGTFSVVMDRTWNNNVVPVAADEVFNFILVGDYMFISYNDGGIFALSKTDDTNLHDITCIYETTILNDGDASITKKLIGITATHTSLGTNGQILLAYKIDNETSFTTIITNTTDNSLRTSAVNIASTGANLPTYKEITFRVEMTGTASVTGDIGELTGIAWLSETISDDIYLH